MLAVHSGDCILIVSCGDGSTSVYTHRRMKVLFQVNVNGQAKRLHTAPAGYAYCSVQAPGDEHTITRTKESDLAGQRFSNLKIRVNSSDILVEIMLSACANSRF